MQNNQIHKFMKSFVYVLWNEIDKSFLFTNLTMATQIFTH